MIVGVVLLAVCGIIMAILIVLRTKRFVGPVDLT